MAMFDFLFGGSKSPSGPNRGAMKDVNLKKMRRREIDRISAESDARLANKTKNNNEDATKKKEAEKNKKFNTGLNYYKNLLKP